MYRKKNVIHNQPKATFKDFLSKPDYEKEFKKSLQDYCFFFARYLNFGVFKSI